MDGKLGIKEKIKSICTVGTAVKLLFTAFLLVSFFALALNGGRYGKVNSMSGISLAAWIVAMLVAFLLFAICEVFFSEYKAVEWAMLSFSVLLSVILAVCGGSAHRYHMIAAIMAVLAVVFNYLMNVGLFETLPRVFDARLKWLIVSALALAACVIVAAIGVFRYVSYSAPNFDFGIWCNMFHNMKESGAPITTCERDGVLSHFAVHFSPIYYLMLPFYFVFPSPITLQILQAVVLYSGVIPLCLLAKHKKLSDISTVCLAFIYCFYPAIATGTFYDLHENCFLVPLLLWCFCFFEKEKYIGMAVFAALTLLVKEDAFVYLLVFALYIFFLKGKKRVALILGASALVYFIAVSGLMSVFGNGIMVNRYDNLIADPESGLVGVIETALLNPGYILTQMFVSKDGDNTKILYLFQLLLPLAAVPLVTRKISRYILVVPVLMNLITMYVYQPNINFQYSFGITAFLFYATLLNLTELGDRFKNFALPYAAVAALLLFSVLAGGKLGYYSEKYYNGRDDFKAMNSVLEEILPEDASVACSTFILPHIADRSEIYEVEYHKENGSFKTDIEYVVLDMRYADSSNKANEFYMANGYSEYHSGKQILILKKK